MSSTPLLEVRSLRSGYGHIEALRGVSLRVEPGQVVSIIGANGAGKTSLLMCLAGVQPAWEGTVLFKGADITDSTAPQRVRQGLVLVPEGRKIFPRLSVHENLELGAYLRSDKEEIERDFDSVFQLFPVLRERRRQAGGTLSGGEQQMLAIGRALMSKPTLLLMDEPSMGVAPLLVAKI